MFGDAVAGGGVGEDDPHTRLGLRVGTGERLALLAGLDWSRVLDGTGEDYDETEDRYRAITSVALRTHGGSLMFRAGGGYELVRVFGEGFSFTTRELHTHVDYHHAGVFEVGATAVVDNDFFEVGLELAAGASTYKGAYGELLLVVRFGR